MKANTRIEIIDDEEDLCFLLKLGLSKNFDSIEYSHTLKDGVQLFKEFLPHWLILDNNLPDAVGWEHLHEFVTINEHVNIICISANPDSVLDKSLKNAYHFVKPLNVNKITDLILSKQEIKKPGY
jgi:DNA-binding response OmpR family regulator